MSILDEIGVYPTSKPKYLNPIDDLLANPVKAEPETVEPSWWEDQMKPTLMETGKQTFEIPKSLGEVGATAVTGAAGWLVGSGLGIAESLKPGSTRESVRAVADDAAGRLTYQPRTQPAAILMEKVGRGIEAVTGPAKEAAALVGESWDSPFIEAVTKFAGEMATFEALGGAGKVKPKVPEWYWKMTVKERGLVEGLKADLANGQFTTAEIRELWKDPTNRAELLKRYQGVGKESAAPFFEKPEPIRASGVDEATGLPAGQGFEMRPRPSEVKSILDEIGQPGPKALPQGQGFELRPRPDEVKSILDEIGTMPPQIGLDEGVGEGFTSRPGTPEAPIVTKAGTPFKTEATAARSGKDLDWNLYEVTPTEGGFAITRKMGKEFKEKGTPPRMMLRDGELVEVGTPRKAVADQEVTDYIRKESARMEDQNLETVDMSNQGGIVQPKGPEGIIGRINQMGGLNVYDDYNAPEMRQFPDMARVMRKAGVKPDEAAMSLNDEGFVTPDGQPFTGDSLIEYLKTGDARNILTPEKQDLIIERRLRRQENEWISQQLANLEAEGIDAGAVEASSRDIEAGLIEAAKAEGYSEAEAIDALDFPFGVKEGASPDYFERVYRTRDEQKRFPRSYEDSVFKANEPQFKSYSEEELGKEPGRTPAPLNNRAITKAVTDKPWKWTADDLMDLKPSERQEKLNKIWGPEEAFDDWFDGGDGPDKRRYWALVDHAADLDRAIIDGDKAEVATLLKAIQKRLDPHDYYAYEEVQGTGGNAPVPGNADRTPTEQIPATERAGTPPKSDKYNQESLPGLSDRETFTLTNPDTEHGRLIPRDYGPRTAPLFPKAKPSGQQSLFERQKLIGSERGSTGPINESEVLQAILKARGKIEEAMPHLETLGRSVYEGGKQRFLDWQAAIKSKLGDLWEAFKGHLRAIFDRLQSGKVGPLENDRGSFSTKVKDEVKNVADDVKQTADEYLGAISTRLGNIDPSLKANLRKFEFSRGVKAAQATNRVLPFLEKTKKMNAADKADFDLARKNGDAAVLKALVTKYGMGKEYHELRNVLAQMHQEAVSVGYDVGFLGNYHPRVLKDTKGFLNYFYKRGDWPIIEKAIREQEVKAQRYLTDEEKAKLINNMLRGYPSGQISLSKPGQMKAREIKTVTPELNKFYMDSDGALLRYINDVTDAIEARRLFGKGPKGGKVGNLNDTLGGYVLDLLQKGKLKPEQERPLRDILDARFNEVGTRGIFGLYKNLSYIDTMGSPISAVTQIGDIAWALYKNGIGRTAEATGKAMAGKSLFKKEDIGIERIASEFADTSKLARSVDKVFRAIGLTKIDNIGKESLINSTYNAARAKTMNPAKEAQLRKELEPIFEKETDQVIKDLKAGTISENVKLYLFNVLSDFQPISLSEMPQKYLTGGNGRIFYMLKTFTLKQCDMFRREAFQKIAAPGTRIEGIKNLLWLSTAFVVMNAGADFIKDFILGRPIDIEDKVVDNLLRLAGISKFVTWKAREEGLGSAMVRQIAPPFKAVDAISKDIRTAGDEKGLEITQSIPVVGKLYYWWFGRGAAKSERKAAQNSGGRLVNPNLKGLSGKLKGLK